MNQTLTMDQILDNEDRREAQPKKRTLRFEVEECGKLCPFWDGWFPSTCYYSEKPITEHDNHPFPDWCELEVV